MDKNEAIAKLDKLYEQRATLALKESEIHREQDKIQDEIIQLQSEYDIE